jgi:hypothetical protein
MGVPMQTWKAGVTAAFVAVWLGCGLAAKPRRDRGSRIQSDGGLHEMLGHGSLVWPRVRDDLLG